MAAWAGSQCRVRAELEGLRRCRWKLLWGMDMFIILNVMMAHYYISEKTFLFVKIFIYLREKESTSGGERKR